MTNQKIVNHFGQLLPIKQIPYDKAPLFSKCCSRHSCIRADKMSVMKQDALNFTLSLKKPVS